MSALRNDAFQPVVMIVEARDEVRIEVGFGDRPALEQYAMGRVERAQRRYSDACEQWHRVPANNASAPTQAWQVDGVVFFQRAMDEAMDDIRTAEETLQQVIRASVWAD